VVRSRFAFDLLRVWKRGTLRQASTASIIRPRSPRSMRASRAEMFLPGQSLYLRASSIFEIAARLEQAGFGPRQDFLDAAVNQAGLVADLDPGAKTLEGYLFPDTYHFPRNFGPAQICAAMVRRFRAVAGQLG